MKGKITKRLVDSLEPDPARDVLVWDTELSGFGLRITRGGVKSYIFQYKIHRRTRRITLGEHGRELTLKAARILATAEVVLSLPRWTMTTSTNTSWKSAPSTRWTQWPRRRAKHRARKAC